MNNKFVKSGLITLGAYMISFILSLVLNLILSFFFKVITGGPALAIILRIFGITYYIISIVAAFFIVGMLSGSQAPMGKVIVLAVGTALITAFLLPIVLSLIELPSIVSTILSFVAMYACILVGSTVLGISE